MMPRGAHKLFRPCLALVVLAVLSALLPVPAQARGLRDPFSMDNPFDRDLPTLSPLTESLSTPLYIVFLIEIDGLHYAIICANDGVNSVDPLGLQTPSSGGMSPAVRYGHAPGTPSHSLRAMTARMAATHFRRELLSYLRTIGPSGARALAGQARPQRHWDPQQAAFRDEALREGYKILSDYDAGAYLPDDLQARDEASAEIDWAFAQSVQNFMQQYGSAGSCQQQCQWSVNIQQGVVQYTVGSAQHEIALKGLERRPVACMMAGLSSEDVSFLQNVAATFGQHSVFKSAIRSGNQIVVQRSDIPLSIENVRRMAAGRTPFVRNARGEWEMLNLHHVGRKSGKMIEIPKGQNVYISSTGGPLHIPGPGSPVRDKDFNQNYWKQRLEGFIHAGMVSKEILSQIGR